MHTMTCHWPFTHLAATISQQLPPPNMPTAGTPILPLIKKTSFGISNPSTGPNGHSCALSIYNKTSASPGCERRQSKFDIDVVLLDGGRGVSTSKQNTSKPNGRGVKTLNKHIVDRDVGRENAACVLFSRPDSFVAAYFSFPSSLLLPLFVHTCSVVRCRTWARWVSPSFLHGHVLGLHVLPWYVSTSVCVFCVVLKSEGF